MSVALQQMPLQVSVQVSVKELSMNSRILRGLAAVFLVAGLSFFSPAFSQNYVPPAASLQPVVAKGGMVVAQERLAARIGATILEAGGNAVDAAVAVGFAMAVTYPRAGNLGGGGFMVIHLAATNEDIAIDYRETAPAASTRDMFVTQDGKPDVKKSRDSGLAIGVPGTVAGFHLAHRRYGSGRFAFGQLLIPAILLAEEGFIIADDIADSLPNARERLSRYPSSAKIFLKSDGSALAAGEKLVQPELGATLRAIAEKGPPGFYEGAVAEKIASAVREAGGVMTADDLKNYMPVIRTPVRGTYRGYDFVSMPLPSSGGIVLSEMLNILEGEKPASREFTADHLHLMIEAMKRAYADRARYLGDPAFVDTPAERLLSKTYAAQLRGNITASRATPAEEVAAQMPVPREGSNTTHFSIVDRDGNAVSNTYTLNFNYGVGLVAEGTGILLNNEMDDFTSVPGQPNGFGLIQSEGNLPGPGKRPLSSMSPTIVLKDGKVVLITGTPGGSRIITAVLQVIVNVLDRGMTIADAVAAPRLHHQWMPDEVRVDRGFPPAVIEDLKGRGHKIMEPIPQTSANSIAVTAQGFEGGPDPRTRGATAAGVP
jgi:gamma-glutamyltranspeptidase/glutathione hydrolase